MHFDALTLAGVAAELTETLLPGRVQQVILPDEKSVGMEIYANRQRHYLLLSAHAQASRVHLVERKLRRGVDRETPLLLLLRKYARGAALTQISLPRPFERVIQFHLDHPEHGVSFLILEPMGRLSNLLLLDAGQIIRAALHPVPPGENAQRVLLPRHPYTLPPAQEKLPPLPDGSPDYEGRLHAAIRGEGRIWKGLLAGVDGISPTLAREIAWRAAGDEDAAVDGANLALVQAHMAQLWSMPQRGDWQPGTILGDEGEVAGFAAYELNFTGDFVPATGISQALDTFYGEKERDDAGAKDAYAGVRNSVAALLKGARERIERQLAALAQDEPAPGEPGQTRLQAEWLLALSSQVQPGQSTLEVPTAEGTLAIPLDPRLTPVEQAERLFDRAAKQSRAAEIIPQRRAQLQADLAFVAELQNDLALAENQPEIGAVREELRAAGYLRTRRKHRQNTPDRSQPLRFLSAEGFPILVGRNARQNEQVTFEMANGNDRWLHVRDVPGSHVVIRCGGQPVSPESLRAAAQLAAYFSSRRGEGAVAVAVTERRFVTRMPGGHRGQVHFREEETLTVPGEMPEGV
jgi:predicted ribosome quality control (RQC) complex YloA/Tae2 family protein